MTGHPNFQIDPRFTRLLVRQRDIQTAHMGGDPLEMGGTQLAQFIRDMSLALTDEVHEALKETYWKPWATLPPGASVIKNAEAYKAELTDVFVFLMNLMLAGHMTMGELAQRVNAKQDENIRRQLEGYDGTTGKCPRCGRDYRDTGVKCFPGSDPGYGWCEEVRAHVNQAGEMLP